MNIPGATIGGMMPQNPMAAPAGGMAQPMMADGGHLHRAIGGANVSAPWYERSEARDATEGYLHGSTLGRADAIKTTAPSGSYVLPADVVSGIGEGNSNAGAAVIHKALSSGPWGTSLPRGGRGSGPPKAAIPRLPKIAKGGGVQKDKPDGGPIPVMLSHGEFVVPAEIVKAIGKGSQKDGWRILDEFVKESRRRTIEKMKKLPGPAK